jgi:MoCo/4Fe-4S cofactor protein with predicted Tat translocation signal
LFNLSSLMSKDKTEPIDLASLRAKLAATKGQQYWRSLEELAGTREFDEMLHREFPRQASEWSSSLDRRSFLKLMAASLALAGLSSCGVQPEEKIVPYVNMPEGLIPGVPTMYATAFVMGGYAMGTLVRSYDGRPTKIEGNPAHPASLGATDIFMQASILGLYDPDRSQVLTRRGVVSTWETFDEEMRPVLEAQRALEGSGLRFLTETVTSPTLASQFQALHSRFPRATWHQFEPVSRDAAREGARLAFGSYLNTYYRIDAADVIVSLDSDFLCFGPASPRYAREFASRRKPGPGERGMSRLYVAESSATNTGATSDHRLPVRPSQIEEIARMLARQVGLQEVEAGSATLSEKQQQWVRTAGKDLQAHRGRCIVIPGDYQPAAVHAMAHAINYALGNAGSTVVHTDPVEARPENQIASLRELVSDMNAGTVDVLVMIGGNPAFDAPADLEFTKALQNVPLRVRMGLYDDETSAQSHWHIPQAHPLETWSDARAFDGTATIIQPLIAPLFNGKSPHEILSLFLGERGLTSHDIVRNYWRGRQGEGGFEKFWHDALNNGVVAGTAVAERHVVFAGSPASWKPADASAAELELAIRPDPTIWDGRFVNNGWLQELPKPLTKLTWDNAAIMAPATAQRFGIEKSDLVSFEVNGRTQKFPVFILPGQPDGSVTVSLGYGRARTGKVGSGAGFDAYRIRTSDAPWFARDVSIRRTGDQYPLSVTQEHFAMEGRAPVRYGTLADFLKDPEFARKVVEVPTREETLYPEYHYDGYAWGMSIDLNACTGCSACVVACQSENNIPIVGKEQVNNSREMQWIRIDQYFSGDLDNPRVDSQPLMCVHCENAPCEVVCPVGATVHDSEGLNVMVYNRCVGTRYCSNNCPYKVRRFNFLQYTDTHASTLAMQKNPDVSVRSRGVMEKCTYCVQRISAARIDAKKENRSIRDGEVVTACQAACPTQAIVFGDINDPNARVRQHKSDPRTYGLLAELNTRPRTTYLAKVSNPNPDIEENGHSS